MKKIDETPKTVNKLFSMDYHIETLLEADPGKVWELLTNKDKLLRWDSMLVELNGSIAPLQKIKLRSRMDPSRSFSLKISDFVSPKKMVWESGMLPFFKGVRTYQLNSVENGTHFIMHEKFSGLMLPMMRKMLPDCELLFGTYVKDLKKAIADGV